jgi:peroxiredoxin
MLGKYRWVFMAVAALVTATAGLMVGKFKEGDYLSRLYARTDFTLLDDQEEFFQLSKFPSSRLLLLVFTPDEIHPALVAPFRAFSERLEDLERLGVDVMMITRTNREVVRNFMIAARFPSRLLLDTSGTVGRNVGVWQDLNPALHWGYALMDSSLRVYWTAASGRKPYSYDELVAELKKVGDQVVENAPKASRPTSSDSP